MTFTQVGRRRQGKMTAAGLDGGLNRRELPFAVEDNQLTDCCNLWWRDGALRSRPALELIQASAGEGERQYTADGGGRYLLRRRGSVLYTGELGADGSQTWNAENLVSAGGWRARCDVQRLAGYDGGEGDGTLLFLHEGTVVAPLAAGGYVPLTSIVHVPQLLAGGVGAESLSDKPPAVIWLEAPNLLTTAFRASYTTDGAGRIFYLPVTAVDTACDIVAVYRDEAGASHTHTISAGSGSEAEVGSDGLRMVCSAYRRCLYFVAESGSQPQALPGAGVSDNLTVTAHFKDALSEAQRAAIIGQMGFGCWFGGENSGLSGGTRLFVSGNPAYPNRVYWSDTDNPLYFPQDNYATVGDSGQAVTAFGKQDEMLVIFKEHELYAVTYRAQAVTAADVSGARFPLMPLHGGIGCDCPATVQLCENRLVWATSEGRVYTLVSGNAYSQCNVCAVSGRIEPLLREMKAPALRAASAGLYRGWYCLLAGAQMLLLHCADTAFTRAASAGEETVWYRWAFDGAVEPERVVSFSDADALVMTDTHGLSYRFQDTATLDVVMEEGRWCQRDIPSRLCTKWFDFGHTDCLKAVKEVSFAFGAAACGTLTAVYATDRGRRRECRAFAVTDESEREPGFLRVCRLTPHAARVRRFGLELSATAAVTYGALTVRYDMENTAEKGVG